MADRFKDSNSFLFESLKENAKKQTQQSKNNWLKVWRSWTEQRGHDQTIENYEQEALKKILVDFNLTVGKKDGQDY